METENKSEYSEQAFKAIENKDLTALKSILEKKIHPDDLINDSGKNVLHDIGGSFSTLETEHFEMFKLLLNHGANPNHDDFKPLIHRLCNRKEMFADDMIKLLISHNADIYSFSGRAKESLLQNAAWAGKTWLVQMLINKGLDVNYKDKRGKNALFHSINAFNSNVETIQFLLDNEANKFDLYNLYDGKLILNEIIISKKTDILNFLVSIGIDINAQDEIGHSIIIQSAEFGPSEMFNQILELGANLDNLLGRVLHRIEFRMCDKGLKRDSVEQAFKKLKILYDRNYPITALDTYNNYIYSNMLTNYVKSIMNRKNMKKYEESIILSLLEMGYKHQNEKVFLDYLSRVKNTKIVKYLRESN